MQDAAITRLLEERRRTLEQFHDPQRSPLAAVARHDFVIGKPLRIGGSEEDDVQLEGLPKNAKAITATASGFEVETEAPAVRETVTRGLQHPAAEGTMPRGLRNPAAPETLPPGARIPLGRYTLRLSHQNAPALVVLDPQNPALQTGPFPRWFDPDLSLRLEATLHSEPHREELILSTLGQKRRALRLGRLHFQIEGRDLALTALRLLEPGADEAAISIFFRDATTGSETYPVGRYIDAQPAAPGRYLLDFNRAYNPACAFSPLYNCPIPPRENVLPVPVRAGEMSPA